MGGRGADRGRAVDPPGGGDLTLQERVELAKRGVEQAYGARPGERRWLVGLTPPSYEDTHYEVSLFVLEGSPPKGFVLVLGNDFRRIRGLWE